MSTGTRQLPWWSKQRLVGRARWAAHFAADLPDLFRGWLVLLAGLRSRKILEFWVGDSNALGMNRALTTAPLSTGAERQVVWHLGPRLMFTVARQGHLPKVRRAARLIRRFGRPERMVLFYSAGEIDVRCHLVPRSHEPGFSLDFVRDYVAKTATLAEEMGVPTLVFVTHSPQSGHIPQFRIFPIRGSLEERVAISEQLRARLHEEAAAYDGRVRCLVLDATDLLSDRDSSMNQELTSDGIHTNEAGIAAVRSRVHELGLR